MSHWVTVYRLAAGLIFVLLAIGLVCIFLPKCNSLREMQRKKAEIERENTGTEERILELSTKREKFKSDPAFVERTARETGMIRPDETVYKFTPREEEPAGGEP